MYSKSTFSQQMFSVFLRLGPTDALDHIEEIISIIIYKVFHNKSF